jgi:hypothetical protein
MHDKANRVVIILEFINTILDMDVGIKLVDSHYLKTIGFLS